MCPTPKVLDEVTQRCVYLEDCKRPGVLLSPPDSKTPGCLWEILLRVPDPMAAESAQALEGKGSELARFCLVPVSEEGKARGGGFAWGLMLNVQDSQA